MTTIFCVRAIVTAESREAAQGIANDIASELRTVGHAAVSAVETYPKFADGFELVFFLNFERAAGSTQLERSKAATESLVRHFPANWSSLSNGLERIWSRSEHGGVLWHPAVSWAHVECTYRE